MHLSAPCTPYDAAVSFLRQHLGSSGIEEFHQISQLDPAEDVFVIAGRSIRSMLRWQDFTEDSLAVESIEAVWTQLIRDAMVP